MSNRKCSEKCHLYILRYFEQFTNPGFCSKSWFSMFSWLDYYLFLPLLLTALRGKLWRRFWPMVAGFFFFSWGGLFLFLSVSSSWFMKRLMVLLKGHLCHGLIYVSLITFLLIFVFLSFFWSWSYLQMDLLLFIVHFILAFVFSMI